MEHLPTIRTCNPCDKRDAAAYEQLKPEAALANLLDRPGYHASQDLFFVEVDGAVVGYLNVLPELGIGRVILDYRVSPKFRPEGILTELLGKALERARSLGARVAHINTRAAEQALSKFLSTIGFNAVRRYYEMSLVLSEADLNTIELPSSAYRHLRSGEEGMLAQIQNSCFEGSWGYNPNTAEDISWRLNAKANAPDDIILALDRGKVIGYCWTVRNSSPHVYSRRGKGRIYMIGVHPDYRNRRIGRELLRAGLSLLQRSRVEVVNITVDNQNVAAIKLYESLGFRRCEETLWYEKVLNAPAIDNQ